MLSCVGSRDLVLRLEWVTVMVKTGVGGSSGDICPTRYSWRASNNVLEILEWCTLAYWDMREGRGYEFRAWDVKKLPLEVYIHALRGSVSCSSIFRMTRGGLLSSLIFIIT